MFSCFGKNNRKLLPEVPATSSPLSNEPPVTPPSPKKISKVSNSEKEHAFLRAAHNGNFSKVQELVNLNIDVNSCNSNGLNALHLAAKGGHNDIVQYLIEHGADIGAKTRKNNTALHISSLAGSLNVVQTLVNHGANVNDQSQTGFTPLYMAAQENHVSVVKYLLEHGADLNLSTTDNFTPLAVAIQQGHDETVSILLDNVNSKNCVQVSNDLKLPPLHIATRKDDYHAVLLLLHHEGDVLGALTQTSLNGFTALHVAAYYNSEKVGRLLLENGAPVDYTSKNNVTALHVAAKWGRVAMVKVLLDFDANVEVPTRDGIRPLHCAASQGHMEICSLLVDHKANCSSKTKNGLVPLHMVAQGNHSELVDFFMGQKSVNVNETSLDFLTPFHISSHCNNVKVAQALMKYGANVNLRAMNGFTALHIATKQNHLEFVQMLQAGSCIIDTQTEVGFTALHIAAIIGSENLVKLLVDNSCDINIADQLERTSLHMATIFNNFSIVALLIARDADIDKQMKNGETCLMLAIKLEHREMVEYLLNEGASISIPDSWGLTALHWAALVVRENMLNSNCSEANVNAAIDIFNIILIGCEKSDVDKASLKGISCLHLAADFGSLVVVERLVDKGADINCRTASGITPLHLACKNNHYDVVYYLLESLDDYLLNMAYVSSSWSPLHFASYFGSIEALKALINDQNDRDTLDERINQRTPHGNTSLHLAVQQVQLAVVKLLLNNFADFDIQNQNGLSVTDMAKIINEEDILKLLESIQYDTVPNIDDKVLIYEREDYPDEENIEELYSESLNELEFFGIGNNSTPHCGLQMSILSLLDYTTTSDSIRRADMSLKINNSLNRYRNVTLSEVKKKDLLLPTQCSSLFSTMSSTTTQMSSFDVEKCDQRITDLPVINAGFLVSFLVDARGGYMQAQRMPQMRIFVPPDAAPAPTRIICHLLRPENVNNLPGMNDCDGFASRILQIHSSCPRFQKPILIEMPHIALLREGDREIVIMRKNFDSESWKEHSTTFSEDTLKTEFGPLYEFLTPSDQLAPGRIIRIMTTDVPSYFALISRFQRDVSMIGPEGGFIESKADKRIKLIFPQGALMKKIQISLEVQNVDPTIINHVAGDNHKISVSPIITVEPKRRKFRDLIQIQTGLPEGVTKEDIPNLKLLFSISEYATKWEDVTSSTELNFIDNRISHSTKISARIWLIFAPGIEDVADFANKVYSCHCPTPYVGKFLAFARRHEDDECQLRCILITDDTADKTLECQESFNLIATGNEIEVINRLEYQIETAGNIVAVTKSDEPILFQVQSFHENRKTLPIRLRNSDEPFSGKIAFKPYFQSASKQAVKPVSTLEIVVPDYIVDMVGSVRMPEKKHRVKNAPIERIKGCQAIARSELDLKAVADKVGIDWCNLSVELGLNSDDINLFLNENCTDEEKAFMTLIQWQSNFGKEATGNKLNLALRKIGREDVVKSCMRDISFVEDDEEVKSAIEQLNGDVKDNHDAGWDDVISSNKTPRVYDESVDESMIVETGDDWSEIHRERLSDISDDKSLVAETTQDAHNDSDQEIIPTVVPHHTVTDTERTSSEKTAAFLLLVDQLDSIFPEPVVHAPAPTEDNSEEVAESCMVSESAPSYAFSYVNSDFSKPIVSEFMNEDRKEASASESETANVGECEEIRRVGINEVKSEPEKHSSYHNFYESELETKPKVEHETEVKSETGKHPSFYESYEGQLPTQREVEHETEVKGGTGKHSSTHEFYESEPHTKSDVEHETEVKGEFEKHSSSHNFYESGPNTKLNVEYETEVTSETEKHSSTHEFYESKPHTKSDVEHEMEVKSEARKHSPTHESYEGQLQTKNEVEHETEVKGEFEKHSSSHNFYESELQTKPKVEYETEVTSETGKHSSTHEFYESEPHTKSDVEHEMEVKSETGKHLSTHEFYLSEQHTKPEVGRMSEVKSEFEKHSSTHEFYEREPLTKFDVEHETEIKSETRKHSSSHEFYERVPLTKSDVEHETEIKSETKKHSSSHEFFESEPHTKPEVGRMSEVKSEFEKHSSTHEFYESEPNTKVKVEYEMEVTSETGRHSSSHESEPQTKYQVEHETQVNREPGNRSSFHEFHESDPQTKTKIEHETEVQVDGSIVKRTITKRMTTHYVTEKIIQGLDPADPEQAKMGMENPINVVVTEEQLPDGTIIKRTTSTSKSTTSVSSKVISEQEIEQLQDSRRTVTISKEITSTPSENAPANPAAKTRKNRSKKKSNKK